MPGLGSRPDALPNLSRALALMKTGQDDDSLGLGEVEEGVREAVEEDPANAPIDGRAGEWMLRYEPDSQVKRGDEPGPETILPNFVPRVDSLDVVSREVPEDDGEAHFFLRREARTAGQGRPADGRAFRSVSRTSSWRR